MLRILFDDEIFTAQFHGGASRGFAELGCALALEPDIQPLLPFPLTGNRHLAGSPVFRGRVLGGGRPVPGLRRLMRPINQRAVRAALARGAADIVHATWYDPSLADAAGERPLVITVHDMTPELLPNATDQAVTSTTAGIHGAKLALLGRARAIVAVSQTTAGDLCRLTNIPARAVRVIHHGIGDGLRWALGASKPCPLPERFVLFVGQRKGYKNFAGVAPSLARLMRSHPDLHLVCIGGGRLQPDELAPFLDAGAGRQVLRIAADDYRLAACYAHARALLFPSLYEGFGMPLLEAMINRCPVICSNRGALPEIGGEAPLYFNPDAPEAIAEMIDMLDRDAGRRATCIALGEARAATFSWRDAAAAHAALYRELT